MTDDFDHLPLWMQRFYRTRYGRWNMRMFNIVADQFRKIGRYIR